MVSACFNPLHPPLILGVFIFWMGEGFQYAIMIHYAQLMVASPTYFAGEVPRSGTFSEPSEVNRDVNALTRMCHGAFWIMFRSRRPCFFHVFSIPIYPPKRIEQYNLPRFQPDFTSFFQTRPDEPLISADRHEAHCFLRARTGWGLSVRHGRWTNYCNGNGTQEKYIMIQSNHMFILYILLMSTLD